MSGTGRVRVAVAAGAAVVLGTLAVVGWSRTPAAVHDADARAQVTEAATAFTIGMMTYDHETLDTLRDHVRDTSTPAFAEQVLATLDGDLGSDITATEASSRVTVSRVLVDDVDDDRGHAVVVVDSTITSTAGTRELTDLYVEVSLVHRDGRWLVDDLTRLAAREAGSDDTDIR